MDDEYSRRAVLRAVAAGTVGSAAAGVATAADTEFEHYQVKPDAVELTFETDTLLRYRPALVLSHLDVRPLALYGWVARHDDRETFCCVYWASYTHQDGVSPAGGILSDSHYGDHEPFYVFVDAQSGDVTAALFSAYHWLRYTAYDPPVRDESHPQAFVIKPWHHYRLTGREGTLEYDLASLVDTYPAWLANGLAQDIQPGAVTNPWSMQQRESWWRSQASALGISFRQTIAGLWLDAGFSRAGATEFKE